jgi:hypothetical protein
VLASACAGRGEGGWVSLSAKYVSDTTSRISRFIGVLMRSKDWLRKGKKGIRRRQAKGLGRTEYNEQQESADWRHGWVVVSLSGGCGKMELVNGGSGGESCSIRLWEREAYVLAGARTSPNWEVRESKHAVEPGANNTGPCRRPHGRQNSCFPKLVNDGGASVSRRYLSSHSLVVVLPSALSPRPHALRSFRYPDRYPNCILPKGHQHLKCPRKRASDYRSYRLWNSST